MSKLVAIGLTAMLLVGSIESPLLARKVERSNSIIVRKPIIVRVQSPLQDVMDINICPGVGTNINFENIGETIETMFLENKSWVGLTTNGSMTANQDQTVTNTATLIHLSPIDPLSIPGVIQTNKQTVQSGLTVITKDKAGKRKTYLFNLRHVKKSNLAVALVDFVPPAQVYRNPLTSAAMMRGEIDASNQERRILVAKLSGGLAEAIRRGELRDYSPKQIDAIRKTIGLVYQGIPLMDAARQHSVDTTLISKLILLGT